MQESGQKERKRPTARVNGEVVRGPGRSRQVNRLYFNDDIFFLIHEAPGALGKKGSNFESGGGTCHPFDSQSALYSRLHAATFAVAKERYLRTVWNSLPRATWPKLIERYASSERQHDEIRGLRATFGDLGRLALYLAEDRDDLRNRLSSGGAKRDKVIAALRARTEAENLAIHREWLDAQRDLGIDPPIPGRRA